MVSYTTYTDIEGADEFVRSLFRPYDGMRVYWLVLTNEEKAAYLQRSVDQIYAVVLPWLRNFNHSFGDKRTIKTAVIYNALGLMNEDLKATADSQMQLFKSLGAIKNLRLDETGARVIAAAETGGQKEDKTPIASKTAYDYLTPYRYRAIPIR